MSEELDLREYFLIVRKRLLLIVIFVLVCTVASGVYTKIFKDPIYEASTKIVVNRTNESLAVGALDINAINSNIKMIETYKEVIKTPAILGKVAEKYPQLGLSAKELAKKIKVSSVNDTQVMTLAVQDVSYRQAAEIVNAISIVFQQEIPNIFQVQNVSILNEAILDDQPAPVSPNVTLNIIIAFVVSLMIAVGIAFLLEYMDDTIKTEADVERYLGQPTLAMVARVEASEFQTGSSRAENRQKAGGLENVTIGE
ncbi:Wzz/FepE/Etk N-terminal domain-containing protein [Paenibacillus sp. BK033]|uniref:YveK family protein n=1 Tax=unclassified Paenibacillus TaxID=185978 RepID=UPI0010460D50|nr:Wzz/FepE/Etk N-terminal domain-containing protein [Paenibacillus sp. BK033]NIK69227.1 capsular polysaccharide biosynthesis protein [Paenibacillus sp. BK720]TCM92817.1 capsular polysaccharide biosynthesis protein [Paenibacillus sp. BK033]